jgi:hypothetical protein
MAVDEGQQLVLLTRQHACGSPAAGGVGMFGTNRQLDPVF